MEKLPLVLLVLPFLLAALLGWVLVNGLLHAIRDPAPREGRAWSIAASAGALTLYVCVVTALVSLALGVDNVGRGPSRAALLSHLPALFTTDLLAWGLYEKNGTALVLARIFGNAAIVLAVVMTVVSRRRRARTRAATQRMQGRLLDGD